MEPFTVATGAAVVGFSAAWWYRRRAQRAAAEIAALRRQLHTERHAARHDPLTGLPNRRAFFEFGDALLADLACRPLVAVLVDLDDFKSINDAFGHAAGDEVLVAFANRFAEYAAGDPVARLGGDEFAGLLTGTVPTEGTSYPDIQELARTLAAPVTIRGHSMQVTASIGMATVRGPADLTDVLRRADAALYRAKGLRGCAITPVRPHTPTRSLPYSQSTGRSWLPATVTKTALRQPARPTSPWGGPLINPRRRTSAG